MKAAGVGQQPGMLGVQGGLWQVGDAGSRCAEQRECSHRHCSAFNVGLIKIITAPSPPV